MELKILWTVPDDCDYITYYRRKGEPAYHTAPASPTGVTILTPVSGSFEGYLACVNDLSVSGYPWGINGYNKLSVGLSVDYRGYLLTTSATFTCPYNIIIYGQFREYSPTASRYIIFKIILKRNSNQQVDYIFEESIPRVPLPGTHYDQPEITSINADFKKDTDFAYTDPAWTPQYLGPYVDTIPTWDEDPLSLSSVSIDYFNLDEDDNTKVTLLLSWIQEDTPQSNYVFWLTNNYYSTSGGHVAVKGLNELRFDLLSSTAVFLPPEPFYLRTSGFTGWLGDSYRMTLKE